MPIAAIRASYRRPLTVGIFQPISSATNTSTAFTDPQNLLSIPVDAMGGCGNPDCGCSSCSCAPGTCSCGVSRSARAELEGGMLIWPTEMSWSVTRKNTADDKIWQRSHNGVLGSKIQHENGTLVAWTVGRKTVTMHMCLKCGCEHEPLLLVWVHD